MRLTLRRKIILLTISLIVFVTVAASVLSTWEIEKYFKGQLFEQLKTRIAETDFFLRHTPLPETAEAIYPLLTDYFGVSNLRLSLLDSSGIVLFDSGITVDSLKFVGSHLSRPEIQMSMQQPYASAERVSSTLRKPMFYAAQRVNFSGAANPFVREIAFIRIAMPLDQVNRTLQQMRLRILSGSAIALILFVLISLYFSSRLTVPIYRLSRTAEKVKAGDMNARFEHASNDELGALAALLNEMMDKIQQDIKKLKNLEKVRSQFLGNVSHELRTPIFALQGYLESLENSKNFNEEIRRKFIIKAARQAHRLNNLLTDLIDISRIESGEMRLTLKIFAINPWLKELVEDLKPEAQDHNISLQLADHSNGALYAEGDKQRLAQVMTNLIENAIKYNKPGGKVTVGLADLGGRIELSVKDTGRGISEEHLSRIFERFYRVDKERSREVGGTGLGLAIVKHIVEAHGSTITVQSTLGLGSTFRFTLKKAPAGHDSH